MGGGGGVTGWRDGYSYDIVSYARLDVTFLHPLSDLFIFSATDFGGKPIVRMLYQLRILIVSKGSVHSCAFPDLPNVFFGCLRGLPGPRDGST